jgi:hypothetical protein
MSRTIRTLGYGIAALAAASLLLAVASLPVSSRGLNAAEAVPPVATITESFDEATKTKRFTISAGGTRFTEFDWVIDRKSAGQKPYFYPVETASGLNIARELTTKDDHPHHKGIWFTIDEVNDRKYWAEKARVLCVAAEIVTPSGNPAVMKITNHWLDESDGVVLTESTTVSFHGDRLMTYDATLTAGSEDVTFHDTKEGLFAIRLRDQLRGQNGGTISNADGETSEENCWGRESAWVDYHGSIDGQTVGVAIFDHPRNFRKSRYHVRNYGLFAINPFGPKAYTKGQLPEDPVTLASGTSLRLRYGLYVHAGDTAAAKVADVYTRFASAD